MPAPVTRAIWFFGPSAAGKKTLIYRLCDARNVRTDPIFAAVGVEGRDAILTPLVPVSPRKRRKGLVALAPVAERREAIFRQVAASSTDMTWLIHGQALDLSHGVLDRLKAEHPAFVHTAVYLFPDRKTYMERTQGRGLALDYDDIQRRVDGQLAAVAERFGHVLLTRDGVTVESSGQARAA